MASKTTLVTGATSGVSHTTASKLHQADYPIYAAARRTDRLETPPPRRSGQGRWT
jgi:NADP-dependent 3-hydroxy acid dehydrogenase YdfG